jgi:DNA invertase Pin-like site-specific DNA recombinase
MKIFEHKGDMFAIIDGDLWLKLSTATTSPVSEVVNAPKKRGRRKGWKQYKRDGSPLSMTEAQKRIREYKPRKYLGPEAEEVVKADIGAGMSLTETCKKYEISVSTYYRLKNELQSRPVREE